MLILSVGMPRAGSGWHYNLVHDLVVADHHQDAREIRSKYHLENFLTEVNCNIGTLSAKRLLPVLAPSLLGNTFAIKAHAGPSSTALALIKKNLICATYIYRDPRDALLSAYEHGQRSRADGQNNAFAELNTFEDALKFMQQYLAIWNAWSQQERVLCSKYEDLLENYSDQIHPLLNHLSIDANNPQVMDVVNRYRPQHSQQADQRGLHFRKGRIGRFREVFNPEQQAALNQSFAPFLERMGYEL